LKRETQGGIVTQEFTYAGGNLAWLRQIPEGMHFLVDIHLRINSMP